MVLGVVALLAAAGVSLGVANAKPGGQELRLDTVSTDLAPSDILSLAKSGMIYAKADIFQEGDAGGTVIGQVDVMAMKTTGSGENVLAMGLFTYKIFGEGEIHVSHGPGNSTLSEGRSGVITGGTGNFRGVGGESHVLTVAGVGHATFNFNSGRN